MTRKYAVNDPSTGTNTLYDSKEEAIDAFWTNIIKLSMLSNTPYMIVHENDDSTEEWFDYKNNMIKSPLTYEPQASFTELSNEATRVSGIIDVTIL